MIVSIDQNCHSLWDALPKLHAVARKGRAVTHFIEDIDVAFTAVGDGPDDPLRLAMERYHGSGGADWGAALFYSDFLGRLPVDVRNWEACTGLTTAALARRLGLTVDELYDRYSPGDNWQLIGPSYAGDRDHHRLISDLTVAELTDLIAEMMDRGERDMRQRFPAAQSQQRLDEWFSAERLRLSDLLARHADGRLIDLYHDWMAAHTDGDPNIQLKMSRELFSVGADPAAMLLLNLFVDRYDEAAAVYNQAMLDSHTGLHALDTKAGELPFFATFICNGRNVRAEVFLAGDALRVGQREFPLAMGHLPVNALRNAGIQCLSGKAALLVLQARVSCGGAGLVLPYRGSSYMPATHALQRAMTAADMLPMPVGPLLRVRFHLLDRMAAVQTPVTLTDHLANAFGVHELPASEFARQWPSVADDAAGRLKRFATDEGRRQWQRQACADTVDDLAQLDARRRDLAEADPKSPDLRDLSHRVRELETGLLARTLDQIAVDYQVANVDFWDSRGAIWPWCVALGGQAFYDEVVANADVYEESPEAR